MLMLVGRLLKTGQFRFLRMLMRTVACWELTRLGTPWSVASTVIWSEIYETRQNKNQGDLSERFWFFNWPIYKNAENTCTYSYIYLKLKLNWYLYLTNEFYHNQITYRVLIDVSVRDGSERFFHRHSPINWINLEELQGRGSASGREPDHIVGTL